MARIRPENSTGLDLSDIETNILALEDGVTAPSALSEFAQIYVDASGGDLKVIFSDGTVKTIVVDT